MFHRPLTLLQIVQLILFIVDSGCTMFKRRLIAADQASVFMVMMSVHISSGLVLHQMMSDHNSSDLAPQCQMASAENNTSGPNSEFKTTAMNRQVQSWFQKLFLSSQDSYISTESGIIFHHHLAMLEDKQVIIQIRTFPKDSSRLSLGIDNIYVLITCRLTLNESQVIADIENEHHGPVMQMHNHFPVIQVSSIRNLSHLSRRYTRYLLTSHSEIVDIE
ncbi:hypothetical protein Tco_1186031 [Tanacetum coccineum]